MRKLLFYFVISFVAISCGTKSEKPNVLFLFVDDLAYDAVSCFGNKVVKTPNMDRIAAKGTRFTNAYNMGSWSGAVCTASRSMLISGMSVWRANAHRENWHNNDSTAIANTWGKLMEKQGYDTYMTGKWHVDVPAEKVFQRTAHIRAGMPKDAWAGINMGERFAAYEAGEKTYNEIMPNGYNRPLSESDSSWSPTDTTKGGFWEGGKHWSEVLVDDAKNYISDAEKKDNPFFMYLAFNATHDPRQAPQEYLDMYPLEDISIPDNFMEDYFLHEKIGLGPRLRDEALAPFPRSEYAIKVHLQEYYALLSHLDVQIGRILQDLEEKGMLENTYVFLTADHGLAMGSHGLMGKQNMYDHSVRVPMLVMGPDIPKGNTVKSDVYLQDVMASALEVAGIEKPSFVEFNSLIGLAKGERKESYLDAVYGAYLAKQRMIRRDGFKLIVYPDAEKILLFDLESDPSEMNDLSDDNAFKDKKAELIAALKTKQIELDDKLDLGNLDY